MGRLIVIEGLDGCGKATQCSLLAERLEQSGQQIRKISFPNYESRSSSLVKMYLSGEFGSNPFDVSPYAASSFYAVDRYASYVTDWISDYQGGKLILADRYSTSNIPFQMPKLPAEEWESFTDWLFDYEHVKLALPKPDLVIHLDMPAEVSQKLMEKRYSGDSSKKDLHEIDVEFQKRCREAILFAAKRLGWISVSCASRGEPREISEIAEDIWSIVAESELL